MLWRAKHIQILNRFPFFPLLFATIPIWVKPAPKSHATISPDHRANNLLLFSLWEEQFHFV